MKGTVVRDSKPFVRLTEEAKERLSMVKTVPKGLKIMYLDSNVWTYKKRKFIVKNSITRCG